MTTAPAVNIKEWIYSLTKNIKIGSQHKATKRNNNSSHAQPNNSFNLVLSESTTIALDATTEVDLPAGSELTVYRKLIRHENGSYMQPSGTLAAIFVKRDGRTVEQICVREGGRITRQQL